MPRPRKHPDQLADRRASRLAGRVLTLPPTRPPAPRCPSGLGSAAQQAWRGFWDAEVALAVDPRSDLPALERWIWALDQAYREREKDAPNRVYLRFLSDLVHWAETQFGMTPLARARLGISIGTAKLTAQDLNRRIKEQRGPPDPRFAGWEDAPGPSETWANDWEEV
jgi:hypothetical protein